MTRAPRTAPRAANAHCASSFISFYFCPCWLVARSRVVGFPPLRPSLRAREGVARVCRASWNSTHTPHHRHRLHPRPRCATRYAPKIRYSPKAPPAALGRASIVFFARLWRARGRYARAKWVQAQAVGLRSSRCHIVRKKQKQKNPLTHQKKGRIVWTIHNAKNPKNCSSWGFSKHYQKLGF